MEFQFTHPGRGATPTIGMLRLDDAVSIHAPREGCDNDGYLTHIGRYTFQFTHPGRGATSTYTTTWNDEDVSIHAPREGCDRI